jgi:hypothetical protein
MAETPEQKYERLRLAVQEAILRDYPNPERKGCPDSALVREVAWRDELIKNAVWQHITHCSPCYAEFLELKEEWRQSRAVDGSSGSVY